MKVIDFCFIVYIAEMQQIKLNVILSMNKQIRYLMIAAVTMAAVFSACTSDGILTDPCDFADPSQMTLTFNNRGTKKILMAGTGTVSIDWGDGSEIVTQKLSSALSDFSHNFGSSKNHTITITGVNITQLHCKDNNLAKLDVSKNTALKVLDFSDNWLSGVVLDKNTNLTKLNCSSNQLAELDLSKNSKLTELTLGVQKNGDDEKVLKTLTVSNTALTELVCSNHSLTSLEVKNNTNLKKLICSSNSLSSLEVGTNPALIEVNCSSNDMKSTAINNLFKSLPVNDIKDKTIKITNNKDNNDYDKALVPINWTLIE